jgi:chromosome segregation ATPase
MASLATTVNAAAILLSLMKELQKESVAINQLESISSQWCSDAHHQSSAMAQVMQGQLDDATVAKQQIQSDLTRLHSEVALATSSQDQREQQLRDALSTSRFAAAEFASEQEQVNKTLEATQHAMRLVKAQMQMDDQQQQQLGSADAVVNNLMQSSADHFTDDEKEAMSEYTSEKPSQTGDRPQQLLQTLTSLHDRLQKEQSAADSEHQTMAAKLESFTDHLSSSIMESKSQVASISIEMAQRKREHTRLDGKVAALNSLLLKVEASAKATNAACSADTEHKASIQKFIEEESDTLRTTLKQMPQLSSELLFDLKDALPVAPSLLQVNEGRRQRLRRSNPMTPILADLKVMASKFPNDSDGLAEAEETLAAARLAQSAKDDPSAQKPQDSIDGFANSAIGDIQAFLKSDGQGGGVQIPGEERILLSNSGVLDKVTAVYGKLLDNVRSKETAVKDQLKWCSSIARDAKLDSDAVERSLKWTTAKLNLVNVAMSEYQEVVAFNKQQQSSLAATGAKLQKLADVEDSELQQTYQTLKQYGQQLLSLESELSQRASEEDRRGAEIVRQLLDRLEKHQGLLQQWRIQSRDRHQAVDSAAKVVEDALSDQIKQADRRQVRLKVEAQVMTSLLSSKSKDKALSEQYVNLSQELCSNTHATQLQSEEGSFHEEAAAIQKSLSSLSSSSA